MPQNPAEFAAHLATPMGYYYLFAAVANGVAAGGAWKRRNPVAGMSWSLLGVGFGFLGALAFRGSPLEMPAGLKTALDAVCTPAVLTLASFASLAILYLGREFFVKPAVAWIVFNAAMLFFGASLTDPNFFAAVMRPDDVPIVGMVVLLGFFLWLATYQAVQNDRRMAINLPPVEKEYAGKVLVWPDLVYSELICILAMSAVLIVWSMLLPAPLESPANPSLTPNPSKAPWYFVGLQELLTFSDAWNVGVVVPTLIILGLIAVPYLDRNPSGSGYYSIRGRKFATLIFLFGFLQLWILPILIGTFLRGPNWSYFGLYEARDPAKLLPLDHRVLSFPYREHLGVSLVLLYFVAVPPLLGRTFFKSFRRSLGFGRFYLMMFLLLYMLTLPIKMILYWALGINSLM